MGLWEKEDYPLAHFLGLGGRCGGSLDKIDLVIERHNRAASSPRRTCTSMTKLFFVLTIFSLSLVAANATEQHTVDRSAGTIREFRHIPERGIPAHILINARGLAIISVVKAGFIFSAKAGEGVVVARTGHGWSGPSHAGPGQKKA